MFLLNLRWLFIDCQLKMVSVWHDILQIIDRWASEVETKFETEYVAADSCAPTLHEWLASNWQGTHNIWMTTVFLVLILTIMMQQPALVCEWERKN